MEIKNLEIEEAGTWANGQTGTQGIQFQWSANIGFGVLTIYNDGKGWKADTEHLCKGEDKEFIKKVFAKFAEEIEVVE